MTERLPGKYKASLHSQPWFHAGHVPSMRYKYTISGLTPTNYPIKIRSKVPGTREPPSPKKLFENVDEIQQGNFFKDFPEYSFIRENDTLMTIEHCDECETHQETTRHDPEKYSNLAEHIKHLVLEAYPMIKVLIKPLSSQPEKGAANNRMGAFEIQVCTKLKGRVLKASIHSKLESRKWPDVPEVLNKVVSYVPTFTLQVNLVGEDSKGIRVKLKPETKEVKGFRSRPVSASTRRPMRSVSEKSTSRFNTRRASQSRKKLPELKSYEKISDSQGCCNFVEIPLNVYEIEVLKSKDYKGCEKTFDAFQEAENGKASVFIELVESEICVCQVLVKEKANKIDIGEAVVTLLKSTGEEYSVPEIRKGYYEVNVLKGYYEMKVEASEFEVLNESLVCTGNKSVIEANLELLRERLVNIYTVGVYNGNIVPNVLLSLKVNSNKPIEGATRNDGLFTYTVQEKGIFSFSADKIGCVKCKKDLVVNHNAEVNLYLPMLNVNSMCDKNYLIFTWSSVNEKFDILAIKDDEVVSLKEKPFNGLKFFDLSETHAMATLEIHEKTKARIVIGSESELSEEPNGYLNAGFSVSFIRGNSQKINFFPAEGLGRIWDIGYIKEKNFIETNVISEHLPENEKFLIKEFKNIIKKVQIPSSIEEIFLFHQYGEFKTYEFGPEKFIPISVFQKVTEITEDYIIKSFETPKGVSLFSLVKRYDYTREFLITRSPDLHTPESLADHLGIEKSPVGLKIAQKALVALLPPEWELIQGNESKCFLHVPSGEIQNEHPQDEIYKEKYRKKEAKKAKKLAKKQEKKSSSSRSEQEENKKEEKEEEIGIDQNTLNMAVKDCFELRESIAKTLEKAKATKTEIGDELKQQFIERIDEYVYNLGSLLEIFPDEKVLDDWIEILEAQKKRVHKYVPKSASESSSSEGSGSIYLDDNFD